MRLTSLFLHAIAVLLCASTARCEAPGLPGPQGRFFDSKIEFQNYFLPEQDRGRDPSQIDPNVLADMKELLRAAVASKLKRLVIPIVVEGSNEIRRVRYYGYLKKRFKVIGPDIEIIASGGTVRSTLAAVYRELWQMMQLDPKQDPRTVLKTMAMETKDIPAGDLLGQGSDIDSNYISRDSSKNGEIERVALMVTNSAITKFGNHDESERKKRSFLPRGDFKEYYEQIARSEAQGGSELDHLAFSMKTEQFKEPFNPRSKEPIVDDFIRGFYRFLPPLSPQSVEDREKTTIRGPRALTEIGFLQVHPDDRSYLISEIKAVETAVQGGAEVSPKALEQFSKLSVNSPLSGAHNRIYRSPPGSVESAFLEMSRAVSAKLNSGAPLLPEYVDDFAIGAQRRNLNGLPEDLLLDPQEFIATQTDQGVVYHGTPAESGIGIIRSGLHVSSDKQGKAAYGRGAYTTKNLNFAKSYAWDYGLVFALRFKPDVIAHMNILDMTDPRVASRIYAFTAEAAGMGRDPYEYLAREHGIDVIINKHVLIENQAVLEMPKSPEDLLKTYGVRFRSAAFSLQERLQAGTVYESFAIPLRQQGRQIGQLDWTSLSREAFASGDEATVMEAINSIGKRRRLGLQNLQSEIQNVETLLEHPQSPKILQSGQEILMAMKPSSAQLGFALKEQLIQGPRPELGKFLGRNFDRLRQFQPEVIATLIARSEKLSDEFFNYFLIETRSSNNSAELDLVLKNLLKDPKRAFYVRATVGDTLAAPHRVVTGELGDDVVRMLKDSMEQVRYPAARALENVRLTPKMIPLLMERMNTLPEAANRLRILSAVSKNLSTPGAQSLIDIGLMDRVERVRIYAQNVNEAFRTVQAHAGLARSCDQLFIGH